jgi:hypothetical protein
MQFTLDYKEKKLIEDNASGLEISKSKVISEVGTAIDSTTDKTAFIEYFLGNKYNFVGRICEVSDCGAKNTSVSLKDSNIYREGDDVKFTLVSLSKDGKYKKRTLVDVRIRNTYTDGVKNPRELVCFDNYRR